MGRREHKLECSCQRCILHMACMASYLEPSKRNRRSPALIPVRPGTPEQIVNSNVGGSIAPPAPNATISNISSNQNVKASAQTPPNPSPVRLNGAPNLPTPVLAASGTGAPISEKARSGASSLINPLSYVYKRDAPKADHILYGGDVFHVNTKGTRSRLQDTNKPYSVQKGGRLVEPSIRAYKRDNMILLENRFGVRPGKQGWISRIDSSRLPNGYTFAELNERNPEPQFNRYNPVQYTTNNVDIDGQEYKICKKGTRSVLEDGNQLKISGNTWSIYTRPGQNKWELLNNRYGAAEGTDGKVTRISKWIDE